MNTSLLITLLTMMGVILSPNEYWLARVIQGEAGINATQEVAFLIEDSIYNRIEKGWCDSIENCALSAYWGHINAVVPSEHSIKLARLALQNHDRTRAKVIFVFSYNDVENLCMNHKEAIYQGHLYFFTEDKFNDCRQRKEGVEKEEVENEHTR